MQNYGITELDLEIFWSENFFPKWRTWKLIAMKVKVGAIPAPNYSINRVRRMLPSIVGMF